MSKGQLKSMLQRELQSLNQEIDRKIVRGKSYQREARLHKSLLSKVSRLESSAGFLSLIF